MAKYFYEELYKVLIASSVEEKLKKFDYFFSNYKNYTIDVKSEKCKILQASNESFCNVVLPKNVQKRKKFTTNHGKALLIHAITHIEYCAIDLALDHIYNFRDLPSSYIEDWLSVASDEVRHFNMLNELLDELGFKYGDFEIHNALFDASRWTDNSFIERMAVVPRYLEAGGLDATPEILSKLEKIVDDPFIDKVVKTLNVILEEEVDHVKKGDYWFKFACNKNGVNSDIYFDIIKKYYPRTFPRIKKINIDARKEAGFSCCELEKISSEKVCE